MLRKSHTEPQVLLEAEELEMAGDRGQAAALQWTALSLQGWSG